MATKPGVRDDAPPGSILLSVHNFAARSADELTLAKGDRIELIERDDGFGDGWFLGRHLTNGTTGLFPEVYTTPAPKGTFTNNNPIRRASDGPTKTTHAAAAADAAANASASQPRHASASAAASSSRPISIPGSQQSSAPASMQQPSLRSSFSSGAVAAGPNLVHTDSPVMNETLSVIDEHMNDLNPPQLPFANGSQRDLLGTSAGSIYSSHASNRFSYIAGHETDEEEHQLYSETEVLQWTAAQVAEYLDDHGVEKAHCEVFKDQEMTGEVLLAMEQSSIFLDELKLGSVGRRLKTWHKIKALQEEVKQASANRLAAAGSTAAPEHSRAAVGDSHGEPARDRASTVDSSTLPRALSTSSRSTDGALRGNVPQSASASAATAAMNRQVGVSPLQSMTTSASRSESVYRPSAQSIRAMQHSRRHSSIDSTSNSIENGRQGHRKQPSVEQSWQQGQAQFQANGRFLHSHTLSSDATTSAKQELNPLLTASPSEVDRGYFSSSELGDVSKTSRTRSFLTKKNLSSASSPMHSRNSSAAQSNSRNMTSFGRGAGSAQSNDLDSSGVSPTTHDGIWGAMSAVSNKLSSFRTSTSPQLQNEPTTTTTSDDVNPIVTRLDHNDENAPSPSGEEGSGTNAAPSPTGPRIPFFSAHKSKIGGLRTISDAVTKDEKATVSPSKESKDSSSRNGAATPSTETTSIDLQKSEAQSRTSAGSGAYLDQPLPAPKRPRARTKTKKSTSAYTRGLVKRTPVEQMDGCDYSGWMKKKSGSLMTTWKSRLFILRGRRLSYYYTDNDSEEKGLIDISFHRVLPADKEMFTGLHASLTGATVSPTSPKESSTETAAQVDLKQNPVKAVEGEDDGLFIFKLVPPRTGLSKGVNFTKPTVHYFAVNSRQEGRLWMAALMKATIDRDEDGVVTTTYNQNTISLAKARARKERPPALKEDNDGESGDHPPTSAGDASAGTTTNDGDASTTTIEHLDHEKLPTLSASVSASGLGIGGLDEKNEVPATSDLAPSGLGSDPLDEKQIGMEAIGSGAVAATT